jgi:RNA polymerase sigma factor (sigma-70 family)|tara:strand:- start:2508 stop:3257 length:750 start_codon:yes stop_codon:yes gene_type:complete
MRKYNVQNYIRYKEDLKQRMPASKPYLSYDRNDLIVKFMPLVENLARKFSTSDQASGVLSINDLIQEGNKGLTLAVDKLERTMLEESEDIEKTLKSFFSKRIKGAIRRAIDINRGNIKIPEHQLNKIRKNPKDEKIVAMFFNSIFSSIDEHYNNDENPIYQMPDKSEPYNVHLLNAYLLQIMKKHLSDSQYHVLRLSFGLDCDKASAIEIAKFLGIHVATANVRISQIKREAIDVLIANVDATQVIDYL